MEKHSNSEPRSHSQQQQAKTAKDRLEHNRSLIDHNSRVKKKPEQQQQPNQQFKCANLSLAKQDSKSLTSTSTSTSSKSRFGPRTSAGSKFVQSADELKKRDRERHADKRKRQVGNQLHSRSSTSTSISTSSSTSTSTASSTSSSSSSSSFSPQNSYSASTRTQAHSCSRSHCKPEPKRTSSASEADTKRVKSEETCGDKKGPDKLPNEVLELFSNQMLDYTKESGLFDELRMRLLGEIETSQEFQVIKENFCKDVGAFCRHDSIDLACSRSKLREQLNASCNRGDFKSAERLEDQIGDLLNEHQHELRQQFDERSKEFQAQIMSHFEPSSQTIVISVPSRPQLISSSLSLSLSSSSSSSSSAASSLPSPVEAPLARQEFRARPQARSSRYRPKPRFQARRKAPLLPLPLPVAPPRTPDDHGGSPAGGQQGSASDRVPDSGCRANKSRPAHVVAVVANIPTPSPSISPPHTPPTPSTPVKEPRTATNKRHKFSSLSPSPPKIRRYQESWNGCSSTTLGFDQRQNRATMEPRDGQSGQQQQRQQNGPKRRFSWKNLKRQQKKNKHRNRAPRSRRQRSDILTKTTTTTTTTSHPDQVDRRKELSPFSDRGERRQSRLSPGGRKRVVDPKRIDSGDNYNYTNNNIDNSSSSSSNSYINNNNNNNYFNKRIAIKMNDEDVTLGGPKVNQHLIRSR